MPIQFTCPHCGTQTDVADEYAGQSGPCAACGRPITIPVLANALRRDSHAKGSQTAVVVIVLMVVAAVLGLFVCGGLFWFRMAGVPVPPVPATATTVNDCTGNLRRIGLAMHNYHDAYKCFPPAYIPDEDGEPMHSWRVLLLPYLNEEGLYEQYDFDEPWDGPNNSKLAERIADFYRCPEDNQSDPSETNYVMIVGRDTFSDGPTARSIADIQGGTSGTIMVVEVSRSGIHWMEPRDLKAEDITFAVNDGSPEGVRSEHPGFAYVLFCDGTVRAVADGTDPAQIKAMSTFYGGDETVEAYEDF